MSKQRASRETGMGAAAGIIGMQFICNCFFLLFSILVLGSLCFLLILLILVCAMSGSTRETEDISRVIADGASGAGKFTAGVGSSIVAARVQSESRWPKKNTGRAAKLSVPDFTIILKVLIWCCAKMA